MYIQPESTRAFSITLSGIFLHIQIIYQGHIDRCHPNYKIPEEFNITHSVNQWSNEEKSIELIKKVFKKIKIKK